MQQIVNETDVWLKAFAEGFIAFPIVYYIVKNFGAVIVTDVTGLWTTYVSKTPVTPVANV